jgi:hypothetical protein
MRSCDQVSGDLTVEIMLNHPKCTRTTNNPTSNPTTCVDEIESVTLHSLRVGWRNLFSSCAVVCQVFGSGGK